MSSIHCQESTGEPCAAGMCLGYPGAREMPKKAVVSYSHVGAIRETALFVECAKKDISQTPLGIGLAGCKRASKL